MIADWACGCCYRTGSDEALDGEVARWSSGQPTLFGAGGMGVRLVGEGVVWRGWSGVFVRRGMWVGWDGAWGVDHEAEVGTG